MVEVKIDDVVVSCEDPRAQRGHAEAIARILSRNWLEDHSQAEPLYVTVFDGQEVVYMARIIAVS